MSNKVFRINGCYGLQYTMIFRIGAEQEELLSGFLKYYHYIPVFNVTKDIYQKFVHWVGDMILCRVFSNYGVKKYTQESMYDELANIIDLGEEVGVILQIIQLPSTENMSYELAYDVIEGER